ncbi:hypothetical protein FACS189497_07090 [Betaproteobacteria bacterium]|nr:hypothetical protein FACS189488_04590 [Betaproteobacteria bacterium]GHU29322.1 hypothetical protein FACS189497_07090 [Betaproteobacteria bacterium]
MKRARTKRRGGIGRPAEELLWLATGLAESCCRVEDRYWDERLGAAVEVSLAHDDEDTLNAALDQAFTRTGSVYDDLADAIESRTESPTAVPTGSGKNHNLLLLAAPVLAWSRFRIPARSLPAATLANLRVHLQAHVLARNTQLALADYLFSPDQLPQGYCSTHGLASVMGRAALDNSDFHVDPEELVETAQFLSDTRYLLVGVAAPKDGAIFRWQENDGNRADALAQWRGQGGGCLTPLLPGCALEFCLPESYFSACRAADKASRPYSICASIAFLATSLEVPVSNLRAVVAPFWGEQIEEYRIGFTVTDNNNVVHGVVWPLLGAEDDAIDVPGEIEAVLRECGVTAIRILDHRFPLEYCDDCGAPLYPSPEGEMEHAEMPELEEGQIPRHLH